MALVADRDGRQATVLTVFRMVDSDRPLALLRLEDGEEVAVPADLLEQESEDRYITPVSFARRDPPPGPDRDPSAAGDLVVPVVEEELKVERRQYETSRVRVQKAVYEQEVLIDEPAWHEEVNVERIPKDRVVDGPIPERRVGDTIVISLVEEELVVRKQFVLKEEVHIHTRRVEGRTNKKVVLQREEATVERVGPNGEPER